MFVFNVRIFFVDLVNLNVAGVQGILASRFTTTRVDPYRRGLPHFWLSQLNETYGTSSWPVFRMLDSHRAN